MESKVINFNYDPISITRLLLQMYVERFIEGRTFKELTSSFYEFIDTMTDEECEDIIRVYALKQGIDVITFDEWEEDFKLITSIIEARSRFQEILHDIRVRSIKNYEFEENKGVSGILLPSGDFIKCGNQEHHLITESISWQDQLKSTYFSSRMMFDKDGVMSFSPFNEEGRQFTREQREWIVNNISFFDNGQKEMADIYLRYIEE